MASIMYRDYDFELEDETGKDLTMGAYSIGWSKKSTVIWFNAKSGGNRTSIQVPTKALEIFLKMSFAEVA